MTPSQGNAGFQVDDYSSGAPSRVSDADVATWDCFDE